MPFTVQGSTYWDCAFASCDTQDVIQHLYCHKQWEQGLLKILQFKIS